jgi:hypothetical protein
MANFRSLLLDDPWKVSPADFPRDGMTNDKLAFILNYATLAPSILNTQPWLFRIADGGITLLADQSRKLPVTDPHGRELSISCGAALLNLRIAARSFAFELAVTLLPDDEEPDTLAIATPASTTAGPQDAALRDAIAARRTDRGAYDLRPLPLELTESLAAAARQEGASLSFLQHPDAKSRIAELVTEAEDSLLRDPKFRDEIFRWLQNRIGRARDDEARQRLGGAASMGAHSPEPSVRPDLFTPTAAATARVFARSADTVKAQRDSIVRTPALALLATKGDDPRAWINAGQALQRALLVATEAGVSSSYLNACIEVPSLRKNVAQAFDVSGHPQVLLRLGYGTAQPPTPRRPLTEVVV